VTTATTLRLEQIKVREGFNARQDVTVDDGFKLSIKRKGILTPLIVRETAAGEYELIAGHRRLAAASELGLQDVPVVVREGGTPDEGEVAAIENMQRIQLNPLEEAFAFRRLVDDGYTYEGVAEAVGVSKQMVENRLTILDLPKKLQEEFAKGAPLSAVAVLRELQEFSKALVEAIADDEGIGWHDLVRNPGWVAERVVRDLPKKADLIGIGYSGIQLDEVKLPKKLRDELEQFNAGKQNWEQLDRVGLTEEVYDQLKAMGAIYHKDGQYAVAYRSAIQENIEPLVKAALEAARKPKPKPSSGTTKADVTDEEKQKRAAERARNEELRIAAQGLNMDLWAALMKSPIALGKIGTDEADEFLRWCAIAEFDRYGHGKSLPSMDEVVKSGLRYMPGFYESETTKAGKEKRTYVKDRKQLAEMGEKFVKQGKTPAERLGRTLVLLIASRWAAQQVVPRSQRGFRARWGREQMGKVVDKIAKPVLPRTIVRFHKDNASSGDSYEIR
jgi:ParB/RepB/Spo0J family partition protein